MANSKSAFYKASVPLDYCEAARSDLVLSSSTGFSHAHLLSRPRARTLYRIDGGIDRMYAVA